MVPAYPQPKLLSPMLASPLPVIKRAASDAAAYNAAYGQKPQNLKQHCAICTFSCQAQMRWVAA